MRKLEDGTYMYDTDTPLDLALVSLFVFVVCALLFIIHSYNAVQSYKTDGWIAFQYLTDSGTLQIFGMIGWGASSLIAFKKAFQKFRAVFSKSNEK